MDKSRMDYSNENAALNLAPEIRCNIQQQGNLQGFSQSIFPVGNWQLLRGQSVENVQSILPNDDEPLDLTLHGAQTSENRKREFCNSMELLIPANNQYVTEDSSSTNTKVQKYLDNRKSICENCGKSFVHKHHLALHNLIHTGEKPFECDKCDKTFRNPSNLAKHHRTHTKEKPYACDKCDKNFSQSSNLKTHSRIHTDEGLYSCDECKKTFRNSSQLVAHRRIHTGKKSFSCDKCDKIFSHKSSLTRHLKIHMGEKL